MPLALPAAYARACYTPHRHRDHSTPTPCHSESLQTLSPPSHELMETFQLLQFCHSPSVCAACTTSVQRNFHHTKALALTPSPTPALNKPTGKSNWAHGFPPNSSDKFSLNPVKSQFPLSASSGQTL